MRNLAGILRSLITVGMLCGSGYFVNTAVAQETLGDKISNHTDEVKKDTKKSVRKAKKTKRDVTGHGSAVKDAGDDLKNVGDEAGYQAKKAKRKAD